jgi:hypothetical protein
MEVSEWQSAIKRTIKQVEGLVVYSDADRNSWYLIINIDNHSTGLHRDYFSQEKYKGTKLLKELKIPLSKCDFKTE